LEFYAQLTRFCSFSTQKVFRNIFHFIFHLLFWFFTKNAAGFRRSRLKI